MTLPPPGAQSSGDDQRIGGRSPSATRPEGHEQLGALGQLGLLIGPLLAMLDSSIVNVAVPDIGRDLHADDLQSVAWVVSGYLLALAAGLPATSYLAKRFGTLQLYLASLLGFVAASAVCAAAPTLGALIAGRAAQGLLGAPLVPLAMSVLLARGGGDRQISATAGLLFFLAPALGPTLGGGLITTGSWRWIFLVNVPIGLLGLLGTRRIPGTAVPTHQAGARFDPVGMVLLAGGLTLALYGTSQGSAHGWTGGLGGWCQTAPIRSQERIGQLAKRRAGRGGPNGHHRTK